MCSRAATCGPTSAGMFSSFGSGFFNRYRDSTEHGLAAKLKAIPAGKCGFSACGRGPRAREKGGGISSEGGTSCAGAGSLNGQEIKDTLAPLTGFRKFVVLLG